MQIYQSKTVQSNTYYELINKKIRKQKEAGGEFAPVMINCISLNPDQPLSLDCSTTMDYIYKLSDRSEAATSSPFLFDLLMHVIDIKI